MANPKVYFIDDDPVLLKLIGFYLKGQPLDIEMFEQPEPLLEAIKQGRVPDLIMSDVTLGSINGFQLMDRVHEINPEIKYSFCSAYVNIEMALQSKNLSPEGYEAVPYYSKPFEMPALLDFIIDNLPEGVNVPV